jgi:hypothetical protein
MSVKVEHYVKFNLPGKESFPSTIPRSDKITETKCMQVDCSKGRLAELVKSLTSAVEMFPTTFDALSMTGTLVNPSLLISCSASVNGLSPLCNGSVTNSGTYVTTYLIAIVEGAPIPRSFKIFGYS